MTEVYLGISAFGHDSAAAMVDADGQVVAAVEEERFTGVRRERRFPVDSIQYCLDDSKVSVGEVAGIGVGWCPRAFLRERLLRRYLFDYPVSLRTAASGWRRWYEMTRIRSTLENAFGEIAATTQVTAFRHHRAHAASAVFASGDPEAAYVTWDGSGEGETLTWGVADQGELRQLGRSLFPHSIGKLYSAVSRYLGFEGAQKDGTVMALAAYGDPRFRREFGQFWDMSISSDGPQLDLDTRYFDLDTRARPTAVLASALGVSIRGSGDPIEQVHMDIAATVQAVVSDAMVEIATFVRKRTGRSTLAAAGGVALNSVANGQLADRAGFDDVFIQPAANDAGLALGSAYLAARLRRAIDPPRISTCSYGPQFSSDEIESVVRSTPGIRVRPTENVASEAASLVRKGCLVGWFQGRLEYGPRALGSRSILADPRSPSSRNRINAAKSRQDFRPVAISILEEEGPMWLRRGSASPFMLFVDAIESERAHLVPSALHVDGSVRVQTVGRGDCGPFRKLIEAFHGETGVPLILNTSLNVRGEPIARTPADAIRVLLDGQLDALIAGDWIIELDSPPSGSPREMQ